MEPRGSHSSSASSPTAGSPVAHGWFRFVFQATVAFAHSGDVRPREVRLPCRPPRTSTTSEEHLYMVGTTSRIAAALACATLAMAVAAGVAAARSSTGLPTIGLGTLHGATPGMTVA